MGFCTCTFVLAYNALLGFFLAVVAKTTCVVLCSEFLKACAQYIWDSAALLSRISKEEGTAVFSFYITY